MDALRLDIRWADVQVVREAGQTRLEVTGQTRSALDRAGIAVAQVRTTSRGGHASATIQLLRRRRA